MNQKHEVFILINKNLIKNNNNKKNKKNNNQHVVVLFVTLANIQQQIQKQHDLIKQLSSDRMVKNQKRGEEEKDNQC